MRELETRQHPEHSGKVQFRHLDCTGKWRWSYTGVRKASYRVCPLCGEVKRFEQDENGGPVLSFCKCPNNREGGVTWSADMAYERHCDSAAGWRRSLRALWVGV